MTVGRRTVVVPLLMTATSALAQQAPRFELTPDGVLTDEPFCVGVLGTSCGGELALLLGATYPSSFRVVVANVPSRVVWPGLSNDEETPA